MTPQDNQRFAELTMCEAKALRCADYLRSAKGCIKQCMPGSYSDDPDLERPVAHIIKEINDLQFSIETILGNIKYRITLLKERKE